ncbi:phage major capsid protein [Pediococcus acidilactici]|nr:phage major capsid protein [Pediococcus acidilactici]KAF0379808.1 phage major capsid protein [Pediococcus acidilactici]KAF0388433.1 phage major capsid protein [Pediococcus acidilactici]KAF0453050.1 phage major capsid protein [Pediococcus acidilactici]KAF0462327.1 phage major capsid protein [Pediococcus acidilactici]
MNEVRNLKKDIEGLDVKLRALNDLDEDEPKSDSEGKPKGKTDKSKDESENTKQDSEKRDEEIDDNSDDDYVAEDEPSAKKQNEGKGGKTMATNLTAKQKEEKKENRTRSIESYIRSHGTVRDAGLKTGDIGPMIPEEVIYNPESEVNSVADLSALVTKTPATTASGTYPILKRATAVMNTVEELAESPELAKPEFEEVTWKIATYRGKIPISEESLQDTQVPLMPVIQKNANEQRLNTLNKAISTKLTAFNAKASTADTVADDLKHVLNVDLDPAYDKTIVVSQSAYQALDTLKDKEGRYLLQESITAASGLTLFGKPVVVVNDELLGQVGEAHIWVGDLKRAILYINRVDTQITWVKNEIYGQYLGLVMRFDVEVADKSAGYFITVGTGTPSK